MTTTNEREPIEIPIANDDMTLRRIVDGAWSAILEFSRTTDDADGNPQIGVSYQTIDDEHYVCIGMIPLEPDLARAAELKERKRIYDIIYIEFPDSDRRARALKAIDAPAETASEYGRGGEAFRERAKECARGWPYTTLRPGLLEKLDAIPGVTEPPA